MNRSIPPQSAPEIAEPVASHGLVPAAAAPSGAGQAQSISSEELLGTRGELKIQHNGELYSLRRTRQGKLILTK